MRSSRPRDVVLETARSPFEPCTTEWIFRMAPRRLPRVGPGTVYRNLKALVDEGRIREVRSADEAVRYHGNTGEHHEVEVRGVCPACPRASLSQPELFSRAS